MTKKDILELFIKAAIGAGVSALGAIITHSGKRVCDAIGDTGARGVDKLKVNYLRNKIYPKYVLNDWCGYLLSSFEKTGKCDGTCKKRYNELSKYREIRNGIEEEEGVADYIIIYNAIASDNTKILSMYKDKYLRYMLGENRYVANQTV